MNKPSDLSKGLEKFFQFHQLEPSKTGQFSSNFRIPNKLKCCGDALWTAYASNKWSGKRANYIHDHESGVKVYRPDEGTYTEEVPTVARNTKTLVRLGYCLGFGYKDDDEEVEAKVNKPYPDLYCTPDGSILLIIENKKKLIAMIWGGHLDVTARGIVG